ncbi:MAG TPA: hypothetical protein VMT18_11650, partial [Planctomycetota bacterium]|nr:hypothetical protein [Planctomycetota bacterium]
LAKGLAGGRPVLRFSSALDSSEPLIAGMIASAAGLQNPLNPFGARQMSIWRYIDMGFGLLDDFYHNLDVEGLNWSPSQAVVADRFQGFRMALAHSFYFPDEALSAGLLPLYRFSGLTATFDADVLDTLDVVHPASQGYTISPADSFQSANGTPMHPWPLNRNIPQDQYSYWTWRDTAVLALGGAGSGVNAGVGVDPVRLGQVTGAPGLVGFYPKAKIPSIGAPLLTEFRTYPDPGALGLNQFQTSFAINSSYRPTFRAFSAGGLDPQGQPNFVDPDNQPVATGGYAPWGNTGPVDNTVYWGQADFVLRVSRAHTRWLDTGKASDFVGQALVEYGPMGLPPGTQVQLAYRGASGVSSFAGTPWLDAALHDPYGDGYTQAQLDMLYGFGTKAAIDVVEFPVDGDKGWHDSLDDIDGARWIQVRLTFVANPVTNVAPQVAGIAIAWQ